MIKIELYLKLKTEIYKNVLHIVNLILVNIQIKLKYSLIK